jgi:hypothetical protein
VGDKANHSGSIDARHAVGADIGAACLADGLPVEEHRQAARERRRCARHRLTRP